MGRSKIIFGDEVLMDLTADTVKADKLLKGYTAHGADGEPITGTCTFDADTQDATATESEILSGKTAYNKGVKVTGAMKNNGAVSGTISEKTVAYTIPQGFHDGSGKVGISAAEQQKLVPANIRQGVTILGVPGEMSGEEGVNAQSKEATPSMAEQTIVPDEGFNYLTQVTVNPIPYEEIDNSAGGKTVRIG